MDKVPLYPGERVDDLIINNLRVIQHPDAFCFSIDSIVLAHFATVRTGATAVDLGAGTGVIGLLLVARGAGRVVGVEIDSAAAERAQRSVQLNGLTKQMAVVAADLRRLKGVLPAGAWDLVVANPPYRPVGDGRISPRTTVAAARHELTASLADVVAAARYLVKYRGRFAMVHLPERLTEIINALSGAGLEPKRLRFVHPFVDKSPVLVLVEAVRGARPGLEVMPPLIVYGPDGRYSPQILEYYVRSGGENLD